MLCHRKCDYNAIDISERYASINTPATIEKLTTCESELREIIILQNKTKGAKWQ